MIERVHLRIVEALADTGTLAAAAGRLHLTQSALSHRMRTLEHRLGVALWRRHGQRLRLTAAGAELLDLARRVLPELERTEARLAEMAQGRVGRLHIQVDCLPCARWLTPALTAFMQHWPDVDVQVEVRFDRPVHAALAAGMADAGLTPDPVAAAGLRVIPVFEDELVLAVGRRHPLAAAGAFEAADLAGEVVLTYPVPRERLDVFVRVLDPAGVAPRAHRRVGDTELMLGMVAAGRGVALIPRWVAAGSLARELGLLRFRSGPLEKRMCLLVREVDWSLPWMPALARSLQAREKPAGSPCAHGHDG
jgi:LysR family transcriptional regulator for metE and metH